MRALLHAMNVSSSVQLLNAALALALAGTRFEHYHRKENILKKVHITLLNYHRSLDINPDLRNRPIDTPRLYKPDT